jgi:hypothetical protein
MISPGSDHRVTDSNAVFHTWFFVCSDSDASVQSSIRIYTFIGRQADLVMKAPSRDFAGPEKRQYRTAVRYICLACRMRFAMEADAITIYSDDPKFPAMQATMAVRLYWFHRQLHDDP